MDIFEDSLGCDLDVIDLCMLGFDGLENLAMSLPPMDYDVLFFVEIKKMA